MGVVIRQLFDRESCTYTYLLADNKLKEALLIDPVLECAERDVAQLQGLGFSLKYVVNTHCHADHITASDILRKQYPAMKSIISKASGAKADIFVNNGDNIEIGDVKLEVRCTPGHTGGCVTFLMLENRRAFTGDALLIRGCGRTDFQAGDAAGLYDVVWKEILSLPDDFQLFPAHDYQGRTVTTVAEEKTLNPRLTRTKAEFVEIMANLGLPYPKQIDRALPANLVDGVGAEPMKK